VHNVAKKEPVSVNWQTLFILIPIVDLIATYRVEKLRLYLLIFGLGFGLGSVILEMSLFPEAFFSDEYLDSWDLFTEDFREIGLAIMLAGYGLAVILIRMWSKEWNAKLSTMVSEKKESTEYVRGEDSSIELLKKRYAMGEISKEEFEKIKKDLENS